MVWLNISHKGRPCLSKQYREENESGDRVAERWIEENEDLVKLLSHTLKMNSPHEYARGLEAGEMMWRRRSWSRCSRLGVEWL